MGYQAKATAIALVLTAFAACTASPPPPVPPAAAQRKVTTPLREQGSESIETRATFVPIAEPAEYRTPPWIDELVNSPDPQIRVQGLEAWVRNKGPSLDPLTYALVDADETVRTRAQELLEQVLERP